MTELLSLVVGFLFLSLMYLLYKIQKVEKILSTHLAVTSVHSALLTILMKNIPEGAVKSSLEELKQEQSKI